jgi:hypothetical protein
MQHELHNLNGAASLYLMIGHLQARADHFETGLNEVAAKVEKLERSSRRKIVPRGWMSSLGKLGLTGKELIILAIAATMGATGTLTPETFRALLLGH